MPGYLRKESPQENARFRAILASSVAVVHPTGSDVAPLLLIEAALFGCPAIASRAFAIPELVADGETGLLLDAPGDPEVVAAAMERMLAGNDDYGRWRTNAWRRARSEHSKARFEARLLDHVQAALADGAAAAA